MKIFNLKASNIKKIFNNNHEILKNISYKFEQNFTYAITGLSGSGKSTFINILAGIENTTSGEIILNDINISNQKNYLLDSIGIVFQEPFLINELTVIENIMLKGLIKNENYKNCYDKAFYFLQKIGLEEKINQYPGVLSGGQKQRISILRAIFNKPQFLLADEPTGNLDETTAQGIIDFLLQCKKEWGMGLIISTHDKSLEKQLDVCLEIKNGYLFNKINHNFVEKNLENNTINTSNACTSTFR